MKNYITAIRNNIRLGWAMLSARTQAALKTAWQTIVAGFGIMCLTLLDSVADLIGGDSIDLVEASSVAFRAFALVSVSALSGLVSYWNNRKSGISYR
jgi:Na+-translocating ferredoxin:NAD+ oxidoreductase RnfE subunit